MPAANTDKLRKSKSSFTTTLQAGGIDASVTTIPLSSTSGLPADTAVEITIDRVDANGVKTPSKKETIIGVVSGSNTTTALRGQDGTTAQTHNGGAVVECIWTAKSVGDIVDWGLADHNQDGTHKINVVDAERYAADAGSTDAYVVTLAPVPAAYATGMVVNFKANTVNTGPATLNVNALGAKTIVRPDGSALRDNDILASQVCTVFYDGTNFRLLSAKFPINTNQIAAGAVGATELSSGAITLNEAKAESNQGSITTKVDLTNLSVTVTVPAGGRRIRISAQGRLSNNTTPSRGTIYIQEGATELQQITVRHNDASLGETVYGAIILTPSAGPHTYKLTGETNTGTMTLEASATAPAFILVEAI